MWLSSMTDDDSSSSFLPVATDARGVRGGRRRRAVLRRPVSKEKACETLETLSGPPPSRGGGPLGGPESWGLDGFWGCW